MAVICAGSFAAPPAERMEADQPQPKCPRCGTELSVTATPGGLCARCLLEMGLRGTPEIIVTKSGAQAVDPPPTVEELAPKFPQYDLIELLGRGGMGAVYKGRQKGLDRLVAIKILPTTTATDPAFAERFTREARALAKLSHPGIVGIHDFGSADGLFYLVMEFVDGANLRAAIRAKTTTPRQALAIVGQVCDALQYAHEEGVVHRDIKPENILLDKRGRVKIADFGLAKLLGGANADVTLTQTHQAMGTPHYMAPEQWEHPQDVDHRADIYSLGVVFYELLTGELPLGAFAPPSKKIQVDVKIDEVVLKTLAKEPQLRYQSASAIKTDVTAVAARPEPSAAPRPGCVGSLLIALRRTFDPSMPGRRKLFGMEMSSNWIPVGVVAFLWLAAGLGNSCTLWVIAPIGTLLVIRGTK
jgi:serine/threonine protein kinase